LLSWPGVEETIGKFGGWSKLEHFAGFFEKLGLERVARDESHFGLLSGVER